LNYPISRPLWHGVRDFAGVVDLLKIAKHGPGENVYLIEFEYEKS